MAEIHVLFPKQGGVFIHNDEKPALQGEFIHWHIHSLNSRIEKVKIRFDNSGAGYFPVNGELTNSIEKPFRNGSTIWGQAPVYGKVMQRRDKYTVTALDRKGKSVAELDPEIIVDKPRR